MMNFIGTMIRLESKFLKQRGTIVMAIWIFLKMRNMRDCYLQIQQWRILRIFLWKLMRRRTSNRPSKLRKHCQSWILNLGILLIPELRQTVIDESSRTNMRLWIFQMQPKSLRLQRNSRENFQTYLWDEEEQNLDAKILVLTLSEILRF